MNRRRGMMVTQGEEPESNILEWNKGEPLPNGCAFQAGDSLAIAEMANGEIHLKCSTKNVWGAGEAKVMLPERFLGTPMTRFSVTARVTTSNNSSQIDLIPLVPAPGRRILLFLQASNNGQIQYGDSGGATKSVSVHSLFGSFMNQDTKFELVRDAGLNQVHLKINDVWKYVLSYAYGRDVGLVTHLLGCQRNSNICEMYVSNFRVEFEENYPPEEMHLLTEFTPPSADWKAAEVVNGPIIMRGGYLDVEISNIDTSTPSSNQQILAIGKSISWLASEYTLHLYKLTTAKLRVQFTGGGKNYSYDFSSMPSSIRMKVYRDKIEINGITLTTGWTAYLSEFVKQASIIGRNSSGCPSTISSIVLYS